MSAAQLERLQEHLQRLRLFKVRGRLEALLQDAPAKETPSADFLDLVLTEEVAQARHHAYAPGPFPLRQEPRDLRLQLAALSRAVSENRLDERLKIYTVAAAVDRRRDLLPADRSHFPETSIPHK